jgi:hypothetical protein
MFTDSIVIGYGIQKTRVLNDLIYLVIAAVRAWGGLIVAM